MLLPAPRGTTSAAVIDALRHGSDERGLPVPDLDEVVGEDAQLALWCAFEVGFRGFDDADADAERDLGVLLWRHRTEDLLEQRLREQTRDAVATAVAAGDDVETRLRALVADGPASGLSKHLQRDADRAEVLAYLRERSVYHLKESDPQAKALPRLDGPAKVALAELLYDEYGAGRPARLHAGMYADALSAAGLDRSYGAYVDEATAPTLLSNNVMSLLADQGRLLGAVLGHLAAFEATSTDPCRRIAAGIERVGLPDVTAAYFHEHVEADAVHEQVVMGDICGEAVKADPRLEPDVLFGAAVCLQVDAAASNELHERLSAGGLGVDGSPAGLPSAADEIERVA